MTLLAGNPENPRTLIDEMLAEQQRLTVVDRFARKHDRSELPAQARYYSDLIPLTRPGPGEQFAFAVDLDACTGCKACVSACHSLNGLDDDEIWRNIGLIHGGTTEAPYQQTVTTACHHCVEPACLLGCPVKAYEKDAETGIVRHLDDQCIGCQYCVLKCPYDVPKYSESRGIVRKCDMCQGRLSNGEAPACVQACPSGAITIRIVDTASLTAGFKPGDSLLPGAFESIYTKPTTTFTSERAIPQNAQPGDSAAMHLEHAHWPLIWMLVLTQIAAGMFLCAPALAIPESAFVSLAAFGFLNLGLAVSILHLGRPLGAWRAFLGLRTSWMSREIFAFGIFAGAAATSTLVWTISAGWFPFAARWVSLSLLGKFAPLLGGVTALLGLLAVFCSAMIYIDTRRAFWNREFAFTKFFGTTLLLGSAGTALVLHACANVARAREFGIAGLIFQIAFLSWEILRLREAICDPGNVNYRSARLLWTLLRPLLGARLVIIAAALGLGLLAAFTAGEVAIASAALTVLLLLSSQVIERYIFFTAVVAPRMPGLLPSRMHPVR